VFVQFFNVFVFQYREAHKHQLSDLDLCIMEWQIQAILLFMTLSSPNTGRTFFFDSFLKYIVCEYLTNTQPIRFVHLGFDKRL
jgi:hypothetical protein